MTHGTIEETYEYRMKHILKRAFREIEKTDVSLENISPEAFFDIIDDHKEELGKALIDDMLEWMDENDWLELLKT